MVTAEKIHPLLNLIDVNSYPKEKVQELWDNLSKQPYAFDDTTRDDPSFFLGQFMLPTNVFFELGEMQGFVSVNGVQPLVNATLHFAVWGKIPITSVMLAGKSLQEFLFSTFSLNRLTAFIPNQNLDARRLAHLLGFKEEGNLRKSFLCNGNYSDMHVFGILRSEYETFKRI